MIIMRVDRVMHAMMVSATSLLLGCGLAPIVPDDIFEGLDRESLMNAEPPTFTFNGEWLSEQYAYSIVIENRIGTVTLPNSEVADVGDVMLVITEVRDDRFSGRHLFRNGKVEDVIGHRVSPDTLVLTGGGLSWRLIKVGPGTEAPPEDIYEGVDEEELAEAEPIFTFDGEWLNAQLAYGMRIENRTGVATLANPGHVDTGDVILLVLEVDAGRFDGKHLFPDGRVREVIGQLVNEETLILVGGGVTLQFERIGRANTPPVVNAGMDTAITLDTPTMLLIGEYEDDGLPGDEVTAQWSVTEGPDSAVFADPASLTTEITFTEPGQYVITLAVSDQHLVGTDTLVVVVNEAS